MKPNRIIVLTWLAWAVIVMGFQAWATARIVPQFPDRALDWTERFTDTGYQVDHVYLLDPFMNDQVAWDSEYYLSIAVGGYDDPRSPHLTPQGVFTSPEGPGSTPVNVDSGTIISSNYAFFPFYPLMIRVLAYPLQVFGLNPIATATLAGVIISAVGTLMGMLALFDLTRDSLGEEGALRAVFYLIIFPTGFFLIQVYTEGLFVGLAFGCLAMLKRKQWLAAAFLAGAATMTRAVGITLIIPMLMTWLRTGEWMDIDLEWRQIYHEGIPLRPLAQGLLALSPLAVFLMWKFSYLGTAFDYVQTNLFGRGTLQLGAAFYLWSEAFRSMLQGNNPQHTAYYLTEFLGLALAVVACILTIKTQPELGWFSFAVVLISWGSGPAQSFHRYILAAPAVFFALAHWGRNPVFDRAWTILSILLMGMLATLFAFDMWVA
ncbi:MAG TPA: mannosyltransferase family protein [Anaerolineales bacterium]